jgi:hypothetical protein
MKDIVRADSTLIMYKSTSLTVVGVVGLNISPKNESLSRWRFCGGLALSDL